MNIAELTHEPTNEPIDVPVKDRFPETADTGESSPSPRPSGRDERGEGVISTAIAAVG